MIPDFSPNGNLPSGIYWATWEEIEARFGWNEHRQTLLRGLKKALYILREVGCQTVYVNGSFVTSKDLPNDFDIYWSPDGVDFAKLKQLDSTLLDLSMKGRTSHKKTYGGELFYSKTFLNLFQKTRAGTEKGIVVLDLRRMV